MRKRKKRHEYLTSERIQANVQRYLLQGSIYIPYNVVSSKNHQQFSYSFKKKRKVLTHSDAYNLYRDLALPYYKMQRKYFLQLVEGLPKPYVLGFYFIRYSKERWDYHNMMQGPADLIQEAGWVEDDDCTCVEIHPEGHKIDKLNQGLIITPYEGVHFDPVLDLNHGVEKNV